ncbi:MAG: YceD family protein [Microthrixaceae bacterium]
MNEAGLRPLDGLRVNVSDLRRRVGNLERRRGVVELHGLALDTMELSVEPTLEVDVEMEAVRGGVSLTGTVRARWHGRCRRCLGGLDGHADVSLRELAEAEAGDDGESYRIEGDVVDLEPVLRDAVLLALPLSPVCRAGCEGPDPEHFPVEVADDPPEAPRPDHDPRWAVLDQLRVDEG